MSLLSKSSLKLARFLSTSTTSTLSIIPLPLPLSLLKRYASTSTHISPFYFSSHSHSHKHSTILSQLSHSHQTPFFTSTSSPSLYFSSTSSFSTSSSPAPLPVYSNSPPPPPEPTLTSPQVASYLFLIAGLVFTIVVVGGMTRLTESGLSITEWNLVTGILPPLDNGEWLNEFTKYKDTPEWRLQNQHISLEEFKSIYFWEYSHRVLGRVIGLVFLLPLPYLILRKQLSPKATLSLLGIGTLIGGQGALGWYMVKSGLDEKSVKDLGGVARVSQYRLAAHLGMAFLVFAGCFRLALGVGRDNKLVNGKGVGGVKGVEETLRLLNGATAARVRVLVTGVTALIFLTALSGAFVAGLDAGLVYNEFPLMGGRLIPPKSEMFAEEITKRGGWWRNFFENPTTVQWDHRVLATTTFLSILSLFLYARRPTISSTLPPLTLRLIKGTLHMSVVQVGLGITTLIYLVPIHLAATHQAGSLVLLSLALAAGASLRRPGRVVREVMRIRGGGGKVV